MAMFHLEYPRKPTFFHWDELACLSRALGFPSEIFYNNIPEEYIVDNDDNGLKLKLLRWLTDIQKVFNQAVDKTSNIHTDEWNLCVIKKALHLTDINAITFEELHGIRVAFQTYENADTKGLPLTEKTLQRTLKLCNRMISPLKMMQRIKHMKDDFDEPGRIQLHEFLDLILWCEIFEHMNPDQPDLDIMKDQSVDLYNIEDFESMLTHYDELLGQKLNTDYRADELTFVKEKHESKAMPKDLPPVDPEKRKRQVSYHRENYQYLRNELTISQKNCHQTKAGYVRSRPITAPDLIMYEAIDQGYRVSTLDPRPATVFETIGHLIPPLPGKKSPTTLSEIKDIVPRPDINRYKRPTTPATLTKEEEAQRLGRMQTLDFEIATVNYKYEQILKEEMDSFMPGYRERRQKNPKPAAPATPGEEEAAPVALVPSEEDLLRMSYHKREPPRPNHGKACDARYRGWHKSKTKRGSHNILVAPYFERSNTGLLYTKLRQKLRHTGNVDTFVHRYTAPDAVRPEKPASRAKKYRKEMPLDDPMHGGTYSQRSYDSSINNLGKKPSEAPVPTKAGSHISGSSTDHNSSDVSWRHLKVYKESGNAGDQDQPQGKKTADRPDFDTATGKMLEMGTVGRVEVLERIKEESGRTTRQSGVNSKHTKTPLGMSQLTRTMDKQTPAKPHQPHTPTSSKELIRDIPPITPSHPPPRSRPTRVQVQTPTTAARSRLGFHPGDAPAPMHTSTANDPFRRRNNRIKLSCLERLSMRIDGLASPEMHRKLMNVDLQSIGMPNPGAEKWTAAGGGLGITVSI